MKTKNKNGGLAFPSYYDNGMTLRQWYKGNIASGIGIHMGKFSTDKVSEAISSLADAMIADDVKFEENG